MIPGRTAIAATLDEALASCSKELVEEGEYIYSEESIEKLVYFLNSLSQSLITEEDNGNEDSEEVAIEILGQIRLYLSSPRLKMEVIDALAFELPKAVARFSCVSAKCLEAAEDIVDRFVQSVSPRDMLSVLCEAISSPREPFVVPGYYIPLLSGLAKVLSLIQRRHYEQVKTAVPVILNVLKIMCSKSEDGDTDCEKLFLEAARISHSIRGICLKLEGENNKNLRGLLGLYVLQVMYFVSVGITSDISRSLPVVLELSDLLHYCESSYVGLITGREVSLMSALVLDESEDGTNCFSQVKLGAVLSVIWGYKNSEVAEAAKADVNAVVMEIQGNWTRRWDVLDMLNHLFSCVNLPWEFKRHGTEFLLHLMDGIEKQSYDESADYSLYTPTMFSSLQAIRTVIMYAPDSLLRKSAFSAFRKVLEDIPTSWRFDVLKALINNTDSSSMIALLLGCVKDELLKGLTKRTSAEGDVVENSEINQYTSFWNPSVLELVEVILRPPKGGPPSLPDCSDSVLSALNLYRYILITESTGNSNSTGILSEDKLRKAHSEWLLPLRTLVTGIMAENLKDCDQLASDTICALNPVELVLYRCIDLVEEKLEC
ncbi:aberrant root formation protein 4 [Andrographis paniculata]|uniref:aberrant root formation protein 4 n=1 Tax=Andrographis paniculata TaxID=175694 RepID=UPI0021E919FD|nr:aberrant root formation protein 4 [Andrographis paniculata]